MVAFINQAIEHYPAVHYCATQQITSLSDSTHFDLNGYTLTAGDTALFQFAGTNCGFFVWSGTAWVSVTTRWVEGYTVQCIRSAGRPVYQQTAATGAATPVFVPHGVAYVLLVPSGGNDAPALQALLDAQHTGALTKWIRAIPGATYNFTSVVYRKDNVKLDMTGSKVHLSITGGSTHDYSWLGNADITVLGSLTLSGTIAADSQSFLVTSITGAWGTLAKGSQLTIGYQAFYLAEAPHDNGNGTFTLYLDHPLARPGVAASVISGLHFGGHIILPDEVEGVCGDRAIENIACFGLLIEGSRNGYTYFRDTTGAPANVVISFDNGCYDCEARRMRIDFNQATSCQCGYFLEGGSKCRYVDCGISRPFTGTGISTQDHDDGRFVDCDITMPGQSALLAYSQTAGSGASRNTRIIGGRLHGAIGLAEITGLRFDNVTFAQKEVDGGNSTIVTIGAVSGGTLGARNVSFHDCKRVAIINVATHASPVLIADCVENADEYAAVSSQLQSGTTTIVSGGTATAVGQWFLQAGSRLILTGGLLVKFSRTSVYYAYSYSAAYDVVVHLDGIRCGAAVSGSGLLGGKMCVRANNYTAESGAQLLIDGLPHWSNGTQVLAGGTSYTYPFEDINANDMVTVTRETAGGTPADITWTISNGVGVVTNCSASDLSTLRFNIGSQGARAGKILAAA